MAETPYYDRSNFFKELVERLEREEQERRAAPADMPADPDDTGKSKSRPLDPKIVEAMRRADQARSQGQGLSLVKSVLDFVRDGGDPALVRGLVTRRDLEDLGVLTSRAESRRKEREERQKRIDEKTAAARERFQAQRKKLRERNLQKRTEAAERNERSDDFTGPPRPQEGDRRSPKTAPAGGMTFDDVLDIVSDFGPVPENSFESTLSPATQSQLAEARRRQAMRESERMREDADREYLLGMDYLQYLTGDAPGSFSDDLRNSPERADFQQRMEGFQDRIMGGEFTPPDVPGLISKAPGSAAFNRAARAEDAARPRPSTPSPMNFERFRKSGRGGTMVDADGDGIDDRIASLNERNSRLKKEEKLRKLEEDNRKLERDRARQEMLKGRQSPTMSPGMGPM